MGEPYFLPKLEELVDCLCTTVAEKSRVGLCYCGVVPSGTPAYDWCNPCSGDTCGMGFVAVAGVNGYKSFGTPVPQAPNNCDFMLQAEISLGVMRCYPLDEDGSPPSLEEQTALSVLLMEDMLMIREAAMCCYSGDIILGQYGIIGPEGGCIGGAWSAVLDLG